MKSLLINAGFGWSATTPYHQTLIKAKYCEKYNKEPHLLQRVFEGHTDISEYISYHNSLPGERVTDFSNTNADLPEEFIDEIAPILLKNFDIKVTMIFRDPIRRLFSACNRVHSKSGGIMEGFRSWVLSESYEENVYYSDIYNRHCQVWGKENVMPIIMEEFSTDKLSDFLGYRLVTAHQNCYYPEMGSNAPKYPGLSDQYTSDKIDLYKETYEFALEHMEHIYKSFENTFGYIPETWKK